MVYLYAPSNGILTVDTFGTNLAYDTVLAVWTYSGGTFTHVACNDDANENTFMSEAVAYLYQGTTYYIEVVQYKNPPPPSPSASNPLSAPPIDEVVLNASFNPVAIKGVGKYDDTNSDWVYSGSWINYASPGPYNNTLHYSNTIGSHAALAFQGNQVVVTYTGYSYRGQMDVYVDNVKVGTIDQFNPGLVWQSTWVSPILTDGVHTLKLVHATGDYVDIDAIEVLQVTQPTPVGVGKYDDTHGNWSFSGNWLPLTTSGPYNNTVTYSNAVGAYATFLMDGAQFKLTYTGLSNSWECGGVCRYEPNPDRDLLGV